MSKYHGATLVYNDGDGPSTSVSGTGTRSDSSLRSGATRQEERSSSRRRSTPRRWMKARWLPLPRRRSPSDCGD